MSDQVQLDDSVESYRSWPNDRLERFIRNLYSIIEERVLADVMVEKMTVEPGKLEIKLTPGQEFMAHMAHSFGEVLTENNAKNYVIMEINHPTYGWMELTIQRRHGEKSVLNELARLKAYDEKAAQEKS